MKNINATKSVLCLKMRSCNYLDWYMWLILLCCFRLLTTCRLSAHLLVGTHHSVTFGECVLHCTAVHGLQQSFATTTRFTGGRCRHASGSIMLLLHWTHCSMSSRIFASYCWRASHQLKITVCCYLNSVVENRPSRCDVFVMWISELQNLDKQ